MDIPTRLTPDQAALVVIDIQERLANAMKKKVLDRNLRQVLNLLKCARLLGLPCLVTEQYPQGLGKTLEAVTEVTSKFDPPPTTVQKVHFSGMAVPEVREWIEASGRTRFILTGIETHVCVFQTARDLVSEAYIVHVPRDGTMSRTKDNFLVGLDLIARSGGVVTSTEAIIFDLLQQAGTEPFKAISQLLK